MSNELNKELQRLQKSQAQLLKSFEKSMAQVRVQNPELAKQLEAVKQRAVSGKEQPLELLNEVIKLANQ